MSNTHTVLDYEFTFDAAHRLMLHEGKCKHLHGHRYEVIVSVTRPDFDPYKADNGMIVDFGVLKAAFKDSVDKVFDHATLLYLFDPLSEAIRSVDPEAKIHLSDGHPTVEVIANDIFNLLQVRIWADSAFEGIRLLRVRVAETANCKALVLAGEKAT